MNLRKGFSHQFKSKYQISNFLMKKFKYLDLPQYLFINMISYCCKQKFLYRLKSFFIINMTRNISETLCNMVKILTLGLLCELHLSCTAHKKEVTVQPQHEVTFNRGHRLHSVVIGWFSNKFFCCWLILLKRIKRFKGVKTNRTMPVFNLLLWKHW